MHTVQEQHRYKYTASYIHACTTKQQYAEKYLAITLPLEKTYFKVRTKAESAAWRIHHHDVKALWWKALFATIVIASYMIAITIVVAKIVCCVRSPSSDGIVTRDSYQNYDKEEIVIIAVPLWLVSQWLSEYDRGIAPSL